MAAALPSSHPAAPTLRRPRGFSLVEIGVALAVGALLATLAVPAYLEQLARSRRPEALAALQQLQWAQERHRQDHGRYAERLDQLRGAVSPRSANGHYRLEMTGQGPQAYDATARAEASQARDRACQTLTLHVQGALTRREPDGPCWST